MLRLDRFGIGLAVALLAYPLALIAEPVDVLHKFAGRSGKWPQASLIADEDRPSGSHWLPGYPPFLRLRGSWRRAGALLRCFRLARKPVRKPPYSFAKASGLEIIARGS